MCGPELYKEVKATTKKADLEGTKIKRETWQELTSQTSELEGTITDNKRKKQLVKKESQNSSNCTFQGEKKTGQSGQHNFWHWHN